MRTAWGDCAAIDRIAFLAAGIRSRSFTGSDCALSRTDDLVNSARFVRLKSGAPRWWEGALLDGGNRSDLRRLLLLLLMWGTPSTIISICGVLNEVLVGLSTNDWGEIYKDFSVLSNFLRDKEQGPSLSEATISAIGKHSPRLVTYVGLRLAGRSRNALATFVAKSPASLSFPELQFALNTIIAADGRVLDSGNSINYVEDLYSRGSAIVGHWGRELTISDGAAKKISSSPDRYPLRLVGIADAHLRNVAGAKAHKLLDIAKTEHWFDS